MDKKDDNLLNNKGQKNGMFELPRSTRIFIFILFFLISMVIPMDGGAIAFSLVKFKEDLNFTDNDFALFTTLGTVSKIIGSFILMFLINIGNRKFLIVIFSLLHIPALYPLIICMSKYFIFGARVINIFIKNFFFIYTIVWCDQFGVRKFKPMMISSLGFAMLIGSTIGKYLSLYMSWKFSMFVLMVAMALIGVIFIFINSDYFSKSIFSVDPKLLEKEEEKHAFIVTAFREVKDKEIINEVDGEEEEEKNNENDENKKADVSYIEDKNEISSSNIFKFPSFFLWVLSLSIVCIPQGILGIFLHEYLEQALDITDSDQRFMMDTATNLITFIVGTLIGGICCSLFDGYDTIKARIMVVILYAILTVASMFLTQMDTLLYFFIIYGAMLLIASAYSPILTGIVLTSVPGKLRGTAQSFQNIILGLVGQLPIAYIYELLKNYQEQDLRFPMRTSMNINFIALFFFVISLFSEICTRKKKKPEKQKKEINKLKSLEIDEHADL